MYFLISSNYSFGFRPTWHTLIIIINSVCCINYINHTTVAVHTTPIEVVKVNELKL